MKPFPLEEIEEQFDELSHEDQLWLIERLVHRLRKKTTAKQTAWQKDLAAMAADPEMQRELRKIHEEFRCTEADGLGKLP